MNNKQKYKQFFLGLLEGDGSIQVHHWRKRNLQFRVIIKYAYHKANYDMCIVLRDALGFMNVHIRNKYIIMVEDDRAKLMRFIVLVERYGLLLTHRRYQYAFFVYCFKRNINYSEYDHIKCSGSSWRGFNHIKSYMHEQLLQQPDWHNWLCGVTEAEGCFCVRQNGRLSFSIAQKNGELMTAIKKFFQIPNVVRYPSTQCDGLSSLEAYRTSVLSVIIAFYDADRCALSDQMLAQLKHWSLPTDFCRRRASDKSRQATQCIGLLGYKQKQMQVFKEHLDQKKLKRIKE